MVTTDGFVEMKEEKKMPDENQIDLNQKSNFAMTSSTDIVLESMEDCVGCLDRIDQQRIFEEGLGKQAALQRQIALEHGLSEAEAALIRLQMIDIESTKETAADGIRSAVENTLSTKIITTQVDELLEQVCGVTNGTSTACLTNGPQTCSERNERITSSAGALPCDILDSSPLSTDLCDGIVLPVDTTLATTVEGHDMTESMQWKSARSLVDVAAEDDVIYEDEKEEELTIDEGATYECAICNDSSCSMSAPTDINNTITSTEMQSSHTKERMTRTPNFCRLPCCEGNNNAYEGESKGSTRSNFKVCTACMLVLTIATRDGASRVGRCPRCREWISILTLHSTSASMVVRKLDTSGQCETCLQVKSPLILRDPSMCDACFISKETPALTYECEECHQPQSIGSTLYRSQTTSKTYGNEMCPCNTCEKSTHWRLLESQLPFIPANDIPEEWGDSAILELARNRVRTAREGIAKLDLPVQGGKQGRATTGICTIM